ncbi:hypothetical protein N0V90_001074 [Kalmusia sp. IMI 367209]|nr:hypothetical protein N0V90_001074 [Kalmusia sp. IMI 367209]
MKTRHQLLLPYFAALASAAYIPHAQPICKELKLAIETTAQNWHFPAYPNATDKGALLSYISKTLPASNFSAKPRQTVSGTFNIAATFCEPMNRTYWSGLNYPNASFDGEYSWVHHATSLGYSTLSIDNLGNGESDHPDPVDVVQFPLQSQILLEIIHGLRAGNLSSSCIQKKFDNVIMVTHSYGSLHGRQLSIQHPDDAADAYILTATASNLVGIQTVIGTVAAGSASAYDPVRLGELPPAYIAFKSTGLKDVLYPLEDEFDPELLAYDETFPHTFSIGELASPKQNVASNFTGPVMVITGRLDPIVCDAQGNNTAHVADCGVGKNGIPGDTIEVFPKAQFGVYVPDRTGHNANLGYSASEVFGAAHTFLELNGF